MLETSSTLDLLERLKPLATYTGHQSEVRAKRPRLSAPKLTSTTPCLCVCLCALQFAPERRIRPSPNAPPPKKKRRRGRKHHRHPVSRVTVFLRQGAMQRVQDRQPTARLKRHDVSAPPLSEIIVDLLLRAAPRSTIPTGCRSATGSLERLANACG